LYPVWAKAVWNPILNDKRNSHAGSFAPKCGTSRLLLRKKKAKIKLNRCKTTFGINQCKVRIERGLTNKLSNKRQSTLSAFQRKGSQ
jgi:hypothetical protein